ncbi:MAG TPA: hypothetical protein PLC24_05580 [Myxococcota bacterium]|nr:hypothetical protein [Myxococcota bacterium]
MERIETNRKSWCGAAVIIAMALFVGLPGCGGKVCPPGTVREGDFCRRVKDDVPIEKDVVIVIDAGNDSDSQDVVSDPGNDREEPTDVVLDPGGMDLVEPEDTGNPDKYPAGYIGMACNTAAVCRNEGWPDGSCLSWPRGFCAMPGCQDGVACPEGTTCMNLAAGANGAYCTVTCQQASDCRDTVDLLGNKYACKLVPDPSNIFKSICYMEVGEASEVGGPCQAHEHCQGAMGCLPNFDGGYCAVLSCDASNPCPEGTACTRLQGRGVCLKSCVDSQDCGHSVACQDGDEGCVGGSRQLSRACIDMKSALTGQTMKVCGSGTVGKPIGEQCLNETECKSGKCNVSYTGTCTDFDFTGRRCTTDADCAITKAICRQSSLQTFGFCTANCGPTTCTVDQSICVMTLADEDSLKGLCLPRCVPSNPEDPFSESDCWEEAGLRCMYGDTKFQPGVRSCVRIDPGDPGTNCRQDDECYSSNCIGFTGSTDGFCTMPCLADDLCPFPTICETVGGSRLCMKRCMATPDCPGTMKCVTSTVGDYCAPAD